MEPTESSETSAVNVTWTPGTYPKDNKLLLYTGCLFSSVSHRSKVSHRLTYSYIILCTFKWWIGASAANRLLYNECVFRDVISNKYMSADGDRGVEKLSVV